jgi:DNA-binding NarL/FixJ family response regulator
MVDREMDGHREHVPLIQQLVQQLGAAWVPAETWRHVAFACHPPRLSPRQLAVLQGIVGELEDHQIAAVLGISKATVRSHCTELYQRLGCGSRAAAVSRVFRLCVEMTAKQQPRRDGTPPMSGPTR